MLFVLDMQGNILQVNDTVTHKLGYSQDELSGQSVLIVHPPEQREEAGRVVAEILAGRAEYCPVPVMTRGGVQIPVETRVALGKWSGQDVIFGITKDISEIKASEEKFSKAFHASPASMAISDIQTGVYYDINDTFLNTMGYSREEIIGKSSFSLNIIVKPERRDVMLEMLNQKQTVRNYEGDVRTKSGEIRNGLFSIDYIQLQDKKLLLSVMSDITEHKRAEEALRETLEHFRDMFERHDAIMLLVEPESGLILEANHAAVSFYGYPKSKLCSMLISEINTMPPDKIAGERQKALNEEKNYFIFTHQLASGETRVVEVHSSPITLQNKTMLFSIIHDVTERKRMENELVTERRRLANILKGSYAGTWEWNVQTGETVFNERWAEIIGYTLKELEPFSVDTWRRLTHPDDVQLAEHALKSHFLCEVDYYELELRMRHKRGHWVWIMDRGKVATWTDDKKPLLMYGTHQDISERKASEDALRESESHFRSLFNQTHDAVFLLDLNGRHILVNQRAADMLGYTMDEITALSINETSAEKEKSEMIIKRLLAGEYIPLYERLFRKKDGQIIPVEINLELINDKNGAPVYIQSIVRDISERKRTEKEIKIVNELLNSRLIEIEQLQKELHEQTLRDPLTGLYNRRYLNETLEREIARGKRGKKHLSIIISDIDHFKKINDTYGHQVGDKFLIEVAAIMKKHARASDIVCRFGGEEFLLVLPDATKTSASKRAEELRKICADICILHEGKKLKITLSFGVATHPIHGKDADELVVKADKAMYKSKRAGRNQVSIWKEDAE